MQTTYYLEDHGFEADALPVGEWVGCDEWLSTVLGCAASCTSVTALQRASGEIKLREKEHWTHTHTHIMAGWVAYPRARVKMHCFSQGSSCSWSCSAALSQGLTLPAGSHGLLWCPVVLLSALSTYKDVKVFTGAGHLPENLLFCTKQSLRMS